MNTTLNGEARLAPARFACPFGSARHPLRAGFALLLLLLLLPLPAWSAGDGARTGDTDTAGTVLFATGAGRITDAQGRVRPLRRGEVVRPGDVVETRTGRAQIQFRDGGSVSLDPDTRFRVDAYRFRGARAQDNRSFFSLLAGAIRALTGSIHGPGESRYRLYTVVATIGIRGTAYRALLCQNDCKPVAGRIFQNGLHVGVSVGAITLRNSTGTYDVAAGKFAYVRDAHTPPVFVPDFGGTPTQTQAPPGIPKEERLLPTPHISPDYQYR